MDEKKQKNNKLQIYIYGLLGLILGLDIAIGITIVTLLILNTGDNYQGAKIFELFGPFISVLFVSGIVCSIGGVLLMRLLYRKNCKKTKTIHTLNFAVNIITILMISANIAAWFWIAN